MKNLLMKNDCIMLFGEISEVSKMFIVCVEK